MRACGVVETDLRVKGWGSAYLWIREVNERIF